MEDYKPTAEYTPAEEKSIDDKFRAGEKLSPAEHLNLIERSMYQEDAHSLLREKYGPSESQSEEDCYLKMDDDPEGRAESIFNSW